MADVKGFSYRVGMPLPYAPEITEKLKVLVAAVVAHVSETDERELPSWIVELDPENAKGVMRLYDFDKAEPARWGVVSIWATEALPLGSYFMEIIGIRYIVATEEIVEQVKKVEKRGMTILEGWGDAKVSVNPPPGLVSLVIDEEGEDDGIPLGKPVFEVGKQEFIASLSVEKTVWTLNKRQRDVVLNHVNLIVQTIQERGTEGIDPAFILSVNEVREALQ